MELHSFEIQQLVRKGQRTAKITLRAGDVKEKDEAN
jgi:hypothetical protein